MYIYIYILQYIYIHIHHIKGNYLIDLLLISVVISTNIPIVESYIYIYIYILVVLSVIIKYTESPFDDIRLNSILLLRPIINFVVHIYLYFIF